MTRNRALGYKWAFTTCSTRADHPRGRTQSHQWRLFFPKPPTP
jgi:hypothetical protein